MAGMILPDAAWRHRAGLDALVAALGPGNARFVGGAVRDTLLGIGVTDVDVATPLTPEQASERIAAAGFKAVPTGIAHGTVTAVLPSGPVEVTTLRRDVATDGRHATVAFTDDWREDASRRDFTMNALYADPVTGEIFDWFDGVDDLRAGRVRFIGDPLTRIAEDHLRILRFFRFLARFGDSPDPEGLAACTARANDLMALSRERIAAELLKLLVARRAPETVAQMIAQGIFAPVLPEVRDAGRLAALAAREEAAGVAPDSIRRLAALLPPDAAVAEDLAGRLKLSTAQRRRLVSATGPVDAAPRALAFTLGTDAALDRLLLTGEPIDAVRDWTPPRFPLTGGAIVARGIAAGPEVARLLKAVERRWVDEEFPDAARAEALADEAVAQALRSTR